jgi:hypothetical protein
MAQYIEEHPLSEWAKALQKENIDFERFEDHLYAKVEERDGEGYHSMQINIYYDEQKGVYANFSALGESIPKIKPEEAISKFKTYYLTFFSKE